MIRANQEVIDFYNKIIKARQKIKFIRNPYNTDIKVYIGDKLIGNFKKEELRTKEVIR